MICYGAYSTISPQVVRRTLQKRSGSVNNQWKFATRLVDYFDYAEIKYL
jgi:hypothetical protein